MSKSRKRNAKGGDQNKKILSDHVKSGKRLIPPMLQVGNLKGVSLSQQIIPEFFWMALLNKQFGWQRGAELSLGLARSAAIATGVDLSDFDRKLGKASKELFAITTAFGALDAEQTNEIINLLQRSMQLDPLVQALNPLLAYYSECPLKFLVKDNLITKNEEDLNLLKTVITPLYDKYSKEAVSMFSNGVYIAFGTNRLKVFEGSLLSKFPNVQNYPDTEESKAIAAGVRATVYTFLAEVPLDWATYFWNKGLENEICNYDGVVEK